MPRYRLIANTQNNKDCVNYLRHFFFRLAACALFLCLGWQPVTWASEVPWPDTNKTLSIGAQREDLGAFLLRFFSELRIPVVISERVKGTVSGNFNQKPQIIFKDLSALYALNSYYDGNILYIYSLSELESTSHWLAPKETERLEDILRALKVEDTRYPITRLSSLGLVSVTAPPRMVQRFNDAVALLRDMPADLAQPVITRVFKLKYASAEDRNMQVGTSSVVLPGLAGLVDKILNGNTSSDGANGNGSGGGALNTSSSSAGSAGSSSNATGASRVTSPSSSGATSVNPIDMLLGRSTAGTAASPINSTGNTASTGAGGSAPSAASPGSANGSVNAGTKSGGGTAMNPSGKTAAAPKPIVLADTRLNTIIVRDTTDRMPLYEELIASLDKQSPLVEIEATIFDVNSSASESLGVDFAFALSNKPELITSTAATAALGGARGTIVLGNNRSFVLAQINALQSKGQGSVLSRPRILSMSNTEATLQSSNEFYVKVPGNNQSSLFNVSAGLTLRVTPTVLTHDDKTRIKLLVVIEDGTVSDALVENIPKVQRSSISVLVEVGEGESLLVGGLTTENSNNTENGVPGLSSIPIIGRLFGTTTKLNRKSERMFMISPRVLYSTADQKR